MVSPAQPMLSGKKMHHFELLFSSKIIKEREIILFQKRKNKSIFGPKIFRERIKNARFVFMFFSIIFPVFFESNTKIQKSNARFPRWIHHHFFMKIHDFLYFFDKNALQKIDTPVCKLKFSRQI